MTVSLLCCFVVSVQLLTNQHDGTMTESKGTTTTSTSADPDAISWLRSTLQSVDQRCSTLQSDLKKAQQVAIGTLFSFA